VLPSDEVLQDYLRRCSTEGPDHIDTLQVRSNLVALLIREDRHDEAAEHASALVDARERIQGPERLETLKARRNLSLALWGSGRTREAWREAMMLRPQAEHCLGTSHQLAELVRGDVARWSEALGLDPDASRPAVPPIKFDSQTPLPGVGKEDAAFLSYLRRNHVDVLICDPNAEDAEGPEHRRELYRRAGLDAGVVDLELRAAACVEAGEFEEALRILDEAIPRLRRNYAREGRIILKARLQRARCLVGLERTDDAVSALRVLLRTCERVLGESSPVSVETRMLLADQELLAGDSEAAAEHFGQLMAQGAITPPGDGSARAELEDRVAAAVRDAGAGELVKASEALADALVDAYTLVDPKDPWLLRLRYSHGATVGYSGRFAEGADLLRATLHDMDDALGPFDADARDCREVLARLLYRAGERHEACRLVEELYVLSLRMEGPSAPQTLRAYNLASYWRSNGDQPFGFTS
jgi:tetratricopeptide (TPR) repeat protein